MSVIIESRGFIFHSFRVGSLCRSLNVGGFSKFYNRMFKYLFLRSGSNTLRKQEGRKLTCKQHSHLGGERAAPVLNQEESKQKCLGGQSHWPHGSTSTLFAGILLGASHSSSRNVPGEERRLEDN